MRLIFVDLETFFSDDYTLKKQTPPEYILDERFEAQYLGVQENTGTPYGVDGADVAAWVRDQDPSNTVLAAHNAMFDAAIFAWRYNFVPSTILCTKHLASATIGAYLKDNKLRTVARALGLGVKDDEALSNVKGLRAAEIKVLGPDWDRFVAYCLADAGMCAGIFFRLAPLLPPRERRIMDMVLRCTIEPRLVLDLPLLDRNLQNLTSEKEALLAAAGTTVEELMSAPKFKAALEGLGVTVENKTSPTGRQIPAFARTDDFMARLAEHDDPRVQAMAAARLGHKSTIEETRCRRLIAIGRLPWAAGTSSIPVPLTYAGTHTHRLSGTWSLNLQNLPKGSELRNSLCAPPGHKLLVADLSQIEARIVATLSKEDALRLAFAKGEDVYASFANSVFGYAVDKKSSERFIGKTAVLGLGYGCGAIKFCNMVLRSARQYGIEIKVPFDQPIAEKIVKKYRKAYPSIVALWYRLDRIIKDILSQDGTDVEQWVGQCKFTPGKVLLPGGLFLHYPKLQLNDQDDYQYTWGRETSKLYGGALLENVVQALARNVAMEASRRLYELGYRFALQVHDEFVFVVPDDYTNDAADWIKREMTRAPAWMPDLPLAVEISKPVDRYGEAK